MSAILQAELQAAREAERVASRMVFRDVAGAGFWSLTEADAADQLELATERAAIQHEGSRSVGLVNVPTSGRSRSAYRTEQASASLRAVLKSTEIDQHKNRLMRMRRSVGFTARSICATAHEQGMRHGYVAMITLTYQRAEQWEPRHVSDALKRCREWHKEQGVRMRYVWVGELQKRGALHYHIAVWLPHGYVMPHWDSAGWWPHGMTNSKTASNAVGYLIKYMSKGTSAGEFPKGARLHGSGGVDHCMRRARRWLGLPAWVQSRSDIHDAWKPAAGGGWMSPDGHVIPSEHRRAWVGDRWCAVRVADYGRPFPADGPFSWIERGKA